MEIDVATEVMGSKTSRELWIGIQQLFGAHSKSNIIFYKKEFQKMQKGETKMEEYLRKMKRIADNLALAGHPVSLSDLVTQVFAGLDSMEYNPIVCQINEVENISWIDLQARLLSYDRRLEQTDVGMASLNLGNMTANYANKRGDYGQYKGSNDNFRGGTNNYNFRGGRSRGRGRRGGRQYYNDSVTCQICRKVGHSAAICEHRKNDEYMRAPSNSNFRGNYNSSSNFRRNQNSNSVFFASPETVSDPASYEDSGASNHMIADPNNLGQKTKFCGKGQADWSGSTSRES